MTEQNNLDSWDSFTGEWLKADEIASEMDGSPCLNVNSENENGKSSLILTLERAGIKKKFGVNITNAKKLKELKIVKPKDLIGKIIPESCNSLGC